MNGLIALEICKTEKFDVDGEKGMEGQAPQRKVLQASRMKLKMSRIAMAMSRQIKLKWIKIDT
ncbi:hypothetical protein [Xanthomonas arboricola]|uniref:hypothetical protein n=1 Tax=Xanthomonas arboricola TaxID=56448 RepID=UPI000A7EFCE8|nr:hypothetical protein [Xanthomonas arboricola]